MFEVAHIIESEKTHAPDWFFLAVNTAHNTDPCTTWKTYTN